MAASIPLINTGENPIGSMDSNKWLGMGKMLREQGVLNKPLDITQVYTTQFLQEIHKR
jgi:hypothetical protein